MTRVSTMGPNSGTTMTGTATLQWRHACQEGRVKGSSLKFLSPSPHRVVRGGDESLDVRVIVMQQFAPASYFGPVGPVVETALCRNFWVIEMLANHVLLSGPQFG